MDDLYFDNGVPRSKQFGDLYFSAEDGYAESLYNFVDGVDLSDFINQENKNLVIGELGFGTGLNFLITLQEFLTQSNKDQHLHFVSIEKYPLTMDEIENALKPFLDKVGEGLSLLKQSYLPLLPGIHRLYIHDQVTLTLCIGDVTEFLPELDGAFDAWYLDGFVPANNPDMWNEMVFENLARLSKEGTKVATFTAAGFVRRGLEEVGFDIQKTKGFGSKRERIVGTFTQKKSFKNDIKKIAVIGAGIAGLSVAMVAKRYGLKIDVFDASMELGSGASGNLVGLLNPKLTALRSSVSDFFTTAMTLSRGFYSTLKNSGYQQSGSIYLANDGKKQKRFQKMLDNLGWGENLKPIDEIGIADATKIKTKKIDGLWMPLSGKIEPNSVLESLSEYADNLYLDQKIENIDRLKKEYDVVVVASGLSAMDLLPSLNHLLSPVRGQITIIKTKGLQGLGDTNFCYGGYVTHWKDDQYVLGATHDRTNDQPIVQPLDDQQNIDALKEVVMDDLSDIQIVDSRASVRVMSQEYMSLCDEVEDRVFTSLAHGSHGFLSSPLCAEFLVSRLLGLPSPVLKKNQSQLSLERLKYLNRDKQA